LAKNPQVATHDNFILVPDRDRRIDHLVGIGVDRDKRRW
jgi:hypothetical protein